MANLKTTQAMPPSLGMSAPLPGQLPVAGAPHGWDAVGIAPAQGGYSGSSPTATLIQTPGTFPVLCLFVFIGCYLVDVSASCLLFFSLPCSIEIPWILSISAHPPCVSQGCVHNCG